MPIINMFPDLLNDGHHHLLCNAGDAQSSFAWSPAYRFYIPVSCHSQNWKNSHHNDVYFTLLWKVRVHGTGCWILFGTALQDNERKRVEGRHRQIGSASSFSIQTSHFSHFKAAAFLTATLYPGIVFGIGFFVNLFIWGKHSSGAIPFTTMLAVAAMWFGISLPLVYLGYYFGYRWHFHGC